MREMEIEKILINFEHCDEVKNVGLHWEKFKKIKNGRTMSEGALRNFRASESAGRDDSIGRGHYLTDANIERWRELVGASFLEENLLTRNVGNSVDCRQIDGRFYELNQFFAIYYLNLIQRLIPLKGKVIWEIGGGYGALAQSIIRFTGGQQKYIFTDLPEANAQAAYYISSHHPNLKIGLDIDFPSRTVTGSDLEEYDILILSPNVKFSPCLAVDLVINTRSMMEMEWGTINSYFKQIQEQLKDGGTFFCVNRYWKSTVGQDIRLSQFPFDSNWALVFSEQCSIQRHMHILIAQRESRAAEPGISAELAKIAGTDNFYKPSTRVWLNYRLQRLAVNVVGYQNFVKVKKFLLFFLR